MINEWIEKIRYFAPELFSEEDRLKNLRLMTGYMYLHPACKCLPFAGENPDKYDALVAFLNGSPQSIHRPSLILSIVSILLRIFS